MYLTYDTIIATSQKLPGQDTSNSVGGGVTPRRCASQGWHRHRIPSSQDANIPGGIRESGITESWSLGMLEDFAVFLLGLFIFVKSLSKEWQDNHLQAIISHKCEFNGLYFLGGKNASMYHQGFFRSTREFGWKFCETSVITWWRSDILGTDPRVGETQPLWLGRCMAGKKKFDPLNGKAVLNGAWYL